MAYCTVAQVRSRNSTAMTDVADSVISEAIEGSDSYIDGVLGDRYPVPLASVPALVRDISADLTAADVLSRSTGSLGTNREPTQARDLRTYALERLDKIAGGLVKIGASGVPSAARRMASTTYGDTPVFSGWDPADPATYGS